MRKRQKSSGSNPVRIRTCYTVARVWCKPGCSRACGRLSRSRRSGRRSGWGRGNRGRRLSVRCRRRQSRWTECMSRRRRRRPLHRGRRHHGHRRRLPAQSRCPQTAARWGSSPSRWRPDILTQSRSSATSQSPASSGAARFTSYSCYSVTCPYTYRVRSWRFLAFSHQQLGISSRNFPDILTQLWKSSTVWNLRKLQRNYPATFCVLKMYR